MKRVSKDEISVSWCTQDVLEQAKSRGIDLSIAEARDVLSVMEAKHDCSMGLNWDVMDYWIDEVVGERE